MLAIIPMAAGMFCAILAAKRFNADNADHRKAGIVAAWAAVLLFTLGLLALLSH